MSVEHHDEEETLSADLQHLGDELRSEARALACTYPCKSNDVMRPMKVEREVRKSRHREFKWIGGAASLGCLFVIGVIVGQSQHRETDGIATAHVEETQQDTAPSAKVPIAHNDNVDSTTDKREASAARFSVRELVVTADTLEDASAANEKLSDAEKIALLEKALDHYRSVIVYLRDEIKTRDKERTAHEARIEALETLLLKLESYAP